jgi:transposase
MGMVLTDERWAALAPLLEACRPKGKTPPRDLRRTVGAIIWRHENGARWRAVPAELGPWWRAAQLFIRWSKLGAWQRLLEAAQARGVELGMAFLDGTSIRAHHKAAGAPKDGGTSHERDRREALGRSRGGFGTKACVIADGRGRAVAFALAPGQAHELPLAPGLLDRLPRVPLWVVGDRGYSADAFRELIWSSGARPAIPTRSNEAAVACPDFIYNNRNLVERLWGRLKEWRAVATRYEKTAASYLGVLCLAATADWLKP